MNDMPSAAAQIIVSIIPIVGIVMGCTVIFFYLLWDYKQKKLMIERGIYKPRLFDLDSFSLFAGLIMLSVGGSLVLFFLLKEGLSYGVLSGLIPFSVGISLIIYFGIKSKIRKNNKD